MFVRSIKLAVFHFRVELFARSRNLLQVARKPLTGVCLKVRLARRSAPLRQKDPNERRLCLLSACLINASRVDYELATGTITANG